jgi:hypothetical protein
MERRGAEIPTELAHLTRPGTTRQEAGSLLAR